MQLDKFTDYGLRILMTLAVYTPRKVSVAEIARMFDVSEHHLSKVATELARSGFIHSERGRNGGLRLAKDATGVSIGAVVRALKQDEPVAECFAERGRCCIAPACGLRAPLTEAQEAFFAVLDKYTLADATRQSDAISRILENS